MWSNGGATVTNNKASSTSNIIDSSNPVRFYKNSDVVIAFTGMTKIEITCNTADYATALVNSISDASVSVSITDKVVTIVPDAAIDSYTITLSGGQVRVDSITVTASTCEHNWGEYVQTSAPTCTENGVNTSTCTLCGETKTDSIPATGHTYTYVDGSMTCTCGDTQAISPISDAKAYTSASQVYYIKGVVTYVSGKNVYIEDATGGICVYFATADDASGIALGDEIVVWDTMTTYNGLIETTNTTAQEYLKVSSGNDLPSQTVTLADLLADTTNEYLGERVVIENVTIGVLGTNNTALTDADGNTINIYKAPALNAEINENDIVTVTAIVSTYNAYQLFVNSADDVVEIQDGAAMVIETVSIETAKAGTAGEYYQVEGTVTYISGRNVYIQDATGAIVVYLTADAATTQVGDKVKAYGALKLYNGLIELDAVDETNTQFYEILSSGNTVDAQTVTIEALNADTTNEYLAEKITLNGVYVSYNSYNSSYGNVTYTLNDGNGNTIQIYRVTVASEEECVAGGSIVNVEAIVSSYNGYQLITTNDKIVVTGTCAHETTELVNYRAATCTLTGFTGDTKCTVCGYYTARGEETPALGHTEIGVANSQPTCQQVGYTSGVYCTVCETYTSGHEEIPMIDHIISGTITPPTCTEQGYTTYACYMCGLVDHIDYIDPNGHKYENGVCTVCGESDPNYEVVLPSGNATLKFASVNLALNSDLSIGFMVKPEVFADGAYTDLRAEFTIVTSEGEETVEVTDFWVRNSDNRRCYDFMGIAPRMMGDTIYATLYGTYNGTEYSHTTEYAITTYCYSQLGKTTNAKFRTLLVDLLNFGAAHQVYATYKTDALVNAKLTAEQLTYGTTTTPEYEVLTNTTYEVIENPTAKFNSVGLYLQKSVMINYKFTLPATDIANYSVRVWLADGTSWTIGSDEFAAVPNYDNRYSVDFGGLTAQQMAVPVYAAIYEGDTAISNTLQYSISSYYAKQYNNDGSNLDNMLIAMIRYGDSAANYFA